MDIRSAQQDKFTRMTTAPIEALIWSMAAPSIVIMLIGHLYNMADTYFVGRLGTSATAGVGVALSLVMLTQAFGFFFGQGAGNYISRQLGARDTQAVSHMAATAFVSAFLFGLLMMGAGLLALDRLAFMLGSTETILPYARDYLRFILIALPWKTGSLVLNVILRFQGSPGYGMIGMVSGAVIGIGLTPLFIFGFGMGIAGAGLSTAIGQCIGCIVLLIGCRRGGNIPIQLRDFSPSFYLYREMFRGGFPSLCKQGFGGVSMIVVNHVAGAYGDAAVAAMTIIYRLALLGSSVIVGVGQGMQPIIGFNYGAERFDRVTKAFWFSVKVSTVFLTLLGGLYIFFATQIVAFFQNDVYVIEIGMPALRFLSATFPLMGFYMMAGMILQTMGMTFKASLLAAGRNGIFIIIYVLTLPRFMGILGLQLSQPIADLSSFVLSVPLTMGVLWQMKKAWDERQVPEVRPAK